MRMSPVGREKVGQIARSTLSGLVLLLTLFPFYWALVSSLKPNRELFALPLTYWPQAPTLTHYREVLANPLFLSALLNSALVALSAVALALVIGSLAAFALGRLQFRGRRAVLYLVLAMTMFPQIAVLGGLYTMVNGLGLYNRLPALSLTYLIFTLPFTVWVLTNVIQALPNDLEEAALVDGATPMQAFRLVLLPLITPGLATTGLLAFMQAWNEFLFALSFIQTPDRYTVTRAIASFSGMSGGGYELPWGQMMAATVIVTLPLVVLVWIFQRQIVTGLTEGAVKG